MRYLYSVTTPRAVAKRSALQHYVHTFFGGSLRQMAASLVSDTSWTDEELQKLKTEIDRVRNERKRS